MQHRLDIDGLRAVAVLPVVLFHTFAAVAPGGFVGVDIFFVISGYLITGLIAKALAEGKFTLLGFYERRVRRLFPALFLMLAFFCAVAWLLLIPTDFSTFAQSAIAAALFVANMFFLANTGYFDAPLESFPLLHTWSLAVEEQFYIVFPLLMMILTAHLLKGRAAIIGVLFAVSFAACIIITELAPGAAFFLAPTRAWELFLGALLALGAVPAAKHRLARELMTVVGIACIAWSIVMFDKEMAWPGYWALLPCVGAGLILHAGASGGSVVANVLSLKPVVYVGLISYSLYLWHWPIIVFADYYSAEPLSPLWIGAAIAAAFAASMLSYHFVERPFRYGKMPRWMVFGSNGLATVAVGVFAFVAVSGAGLPQRFPESANATALQTADYTDMMIKERHFSMYQRGTCFLDYEQNAADYSIDRCAPPSSARRVLIVGDSYAANLYPGLRAHFQGMPVTVFQYTSASCRPLLLGRDRCIAFVERISEVVSVSAPDVVIVSGSWARIVNRAGEEVVLDGVAETLRRVKASGARVILVGQSPTYRVPIPRMAIEDESIRDDPAVVIEAHNRTSLNAALAKLAESSGVDFYNPYDECDGVRCTVMQNGHPFHWDVGHMTQEGSEFYTRSLADRILGF